MVQKPPQKKRKLYLTKIRENAGMSLRELARRLGIHPSNLSYWEVSGRPPKSDLLIPMAKILGVSVEELLGIPKKKKSQNIS